jgi:glycosyltransferase involved in cell wall biosynthesis
MSPRVSILVNVYDGERFLAAALRSALAQTFRDWELIFWDDRSHDGSAAIVRSFTDPRLRYLLAPRFTPLAEARRQAIEQASGEWLAFLDQDDLWVPDKLERQLALVDAEGPDLGIVYGRAIRLGPRGPERDHDHVHEFRPLPEGRLFEELLRHGNFIAMSSALVRRSAYHAVGGIEPEFEIGPDAYLFFALSRAGWRARALQEPCCWYRIHGGNMTARSRVGSHTEKLTLLDRWAAEIDPALRQQRMAVYHTLIAVEELRSRPLGGLRRLLTRGSLPYLLSRPFARGFRWLRRSRRGPDLPAPPAGLDGRARRVLYVHHNADLYGASRSLLRLVGSLDRARFAPLVVLPEEGPLRVRLEELGVPVVIHTGLAVVTRAAFRSGGFLLRVPRSVLFLARLIRDREVDLVHTNTGVVLSSAPAAWLAGVPHVWHIREWFGEFGRLWRPYARWVLALSRRVVAVSRAVAAQFPADLRVAVVPNGFAAAEFRVDAPSLRAGSRQRHGLGPGPVVGCVGRIKWVRKGQEVLVRAAALLAARGVDARYLLVGGPAPGNEAHLRDLQALIAELGLGHSFVLAGELDDVRPAYAAMDLLVLPSAQPEPFAGVVLEAMAMELPVVATAIGGSLDQVEDGVTGYLVPPGDPQALADRIDLLLADADLRERMGRAGRARVAERFSLADTAGRVQTIYEGLLDRP